ncbi:hypothetical protein [Arcticibacter eurypsychrophilus]|uniref:hypothetical protein n=1 Tax=Arcticibacter eurypsychrophilus TaxID=1434752 RepID=UPI00084D89E0|nr:hypothetical protein [Arcticibacter eurypsychrophilus]
MKKKFKVAQAIRWLFPIVITVMTLSCKREDVNPEGDQSPKDLKVELLVNYLSDLTGTDAAAISYNAVTQMYQINGVDQISREKLEELSENHPVLHYKNGVPVSNK